MVHSYEEDEKNYFYVYLYDIEKDVPCISDICFESLYDAYEYCKTEYKVGIDALWVEVEDLWITVNMILLHQ